MRIRKADLQEVTIKAMRRVSRGVCKTGRRTSTQRHRDKRRLPKSREREIVKKEVDR